MSYIHSFLGDLDVTISEIYSKEVDEFETNGLDHSQYFLDYLNYIVLHNPFRKFTYFAARNILSNLFKKVSSKTLLEGKGKKWKKTCIFQKQNSLLFIIMAVISECILLVVKSRLSYNQI